MPNNLELLRCLFLDYSAATDQKLDGIIVPSTDEWHNEYPPPESRRLEWLTGFTGSNGLALISRLHKVFWTDSRYLLQAKHELGEGWLIYDMHTSNCWEVLQFFSKSTIGFDPSLHTIVEFERYQSIMGKYGISLQPLVTNPIDKIRQINKPSSDFAFIIPDEYSGENSQSKIQRVRKKVHNDFGFDCPDYFFFAAADSICWLLNIRGRDLPHTPLLLCYLLFNLGSDSNNQKHMLFVNTDKIQTEVLNYLADLNVEVYNIAQLQVVIADLLSVAKNNSNNHQQKKIAADSKKTSASFFILAQNLNNALLPYQDPSELFKSIKNPQEQIGMKLAHLHDGIALAKFFAWLKQSELDQSELEKTDPEQLGLEQYDAKQSEFLPLYQKKFKHGSKQERNNENNITTKISEITAEEKLLEFRSQSDDFICNSFATISGFKENGAIIHYRANAKTDKVIIGGGESGLYLLDSGGQYQYGTTDVTRTIMINGSPTPKQKEHFTAVLKGHIMLAAAIFPVNTTGNHLDVLARYSLWQLGLNYGHGTGHGVGHFLSVHEGPQGISKNNNVVLQPGMVVSIEPGFYLEGEYGIRCENLYCIQKVAGGFDNEIDDSFFLFWIG